MDCLLFMLACQMVLLLFLFILGKTPESSLLCFSSYMLATLPQADILNLGLYSFFHDFPSALAIMVMFHIYQLEPHIHLLSSFCHVGELHDSIHVLRKNIF